MNYDKSKVSPRPWSIGVDMCDEIVDAKGHAVCEFVQFEGGGMGSSEDIGHTIHCVNHHDPLVEMLKRGQHFVYRLCNKLDVDWDDKALNRWFGQINDFLSSGEPFRDEDWIEVMNGKPSYDALVEALQPFIDFRYGDLDEVGLANAYDNAEKVLAAAKGKPDA